MTAPPANDEPPPPLSTDELETIRFELTEFCGDPLTMAARDAHALRLLAEVDRLRGIEQIAAARCRWIRKLESKLDEYEYSWFIPTDDGEECDSCDDD